MSISMIGFTANDTMTKSVSAVMNMGQVMLLRGLFATILIVLLAWSQGALRNPRQALPRSTIFERVWGYDFGTRSNSLGVYVGYLRRKLEDAGARPLIHTVRGVGYALREP